MPDIEHVASSLVGFQARDCDHKAYKANPILSLGDPREAGERWAQNVVLWSGEDAVPRLILLR